MKNVEPTVFLIARTRVEREEAMRWIRSLGADRYEIDADCSDGEVLTEVAGRRCYMSFQVGLNPNVSKTRDDLVAYIDNILRSKHGSILQHTNYTFAIENVSRVFTAEMNRHHAGVAVSEGSLRYIRFVDIPWWVPPSMRPATDDDEETANRKARTLAVFTRLFQQQEDGYRELEEIWDLTGISANSKAFTVKKKLTSLFRRVIGMGVATGGIWTLNLQALRHVLTMRCDEAAEEEIQHVATMILERIQKEESVIFGDFSQNEKGYWQPTYWKV